MLDAPEALSLRSRFTIPAHSRINVRADSTSTFVCETAVLQVLGGVMWPTNQAREIWVYWPRAPCPQCLHLCHTARIQATQAVVSKTTCSKLTPHNHLCNTCRCRKLVWFDEPSSVEGQIWTRKSLAVLVGSLTAISIQFLLCRQARHSRQSARF